LVAAFLPSSKFLGTPSTAAAGSGSRIPKAV
jgi:hypothetical protein